MNPQPPSQSETRKRPGDPTAAASDATVDLASQTPGDGTADDDRISLAQAPQTPMPTLLGRFEVLGILGEGGFGIVYRARDGQLHRDVAIKVAKPLRRSARYRALYLNEAKLLAQLDHPGIVPVFDVGETPEGDWYVVSKFIDGRPLSHLVRSQPADCRRVAETLSTVAAAMAYAHQRRVIHRDLKPGNILIAEDGRPVVVDFGLAMGEGFSGGAVGIVGTPSYMSPEQARGESHRVDGRADIYSLGVIFYQWLTGSLPFSAESRDELLDQIRNAEVRPPRQLRRDLPRELERICLKALNKRAADRYSTAQDFAEDLDAWLAAEEAERPAKSVGGSHASGRSADSEASHRSGGSHRSAAAVELVPRGLRSYGPADADFFLKMLPGPVDRDGVPECVRFWKQRIEAADADQTFRVGVLMGPSGSGKSSLVRAGILPLLDSRVHVITLESRPQGLGGRLAAKLQPFLPAGGLRSDMAALLAEVRDRVNDDEKVLLVFDQFEAFLHQGEEDRRGLAEALRQCDGRRLQALLILRDDFVMPATGFMNELEEPLLQDVNFAVVDRFGKPHARRVLTGFGVALQTVDADGPGRDEKRFIEQAVDALAEDGTVIPVRLAMLTEMLKDSAWTPAALRQIGGWSGLGIAFLQQRLNGPQAHPKFVRKPDLVRAILECLLPVDTVSIRQHALTVDEIIERCGGGEASEDVRQILQLLDSEVRLITAASSDDGHSSISASPRYQLSHDYLVPAIRGWSETQDQANWRSRLRLRLRHAAKVWAMARSPALLASPAGWLSWKLLTPRSGWSEIERQYMDASQRRVTKLAALWAAVVLLLSATGQWMLQRQRDAGMLEAIRSADLVELPTLLGAVDPRRVTAVLRRSEEDAANLPYNFRLALLPEVPEHLSAVLTGLSELGPGRVDAMASLLARTGRSDWPQLESLVREGSLRERLTAAALLSRVGADSRLLRNYLGSHAPADLDALAFNEVIPWIEGLRPLSDHLVASAITALRRDDSNLDRNRLLLLLQAYVPASETDRWAEIVSLLSPRELAELASVLQNAPAEQLATRLREHFREAAASADTVPTAAPLDSQWLKRIAAAHGAAGEHFVMVPDLDAAELSQLHDALQKEGYRIYSRRQAARSAAEASGENAESRWNVVWRRDGRRSELIGPIDSSRIAEVLDALNEQQRTVEDVAYVTRRWPLDSESAIAAAGAAKGGWLVTAAIDDSEEATDATAKSKDGDSVASFYTSLEDLFVDQRVRESEDFSLHRLAWNTNTGETIEAIAVWTIDSGIGLDRTATSTRRYRAHFGDIYPGATATDVRLIGMSGGGADPSTWFGVDAVARELPQLPQSPGDWTADMLLRLRDARRWDLLLELDASDWTADKAARLESLRPVALMYSGRAAEARVLLEQGESQRLTSTRRCLKAAAAALDDDPTAAKLLAPLLAPSEQPNPYHARAAAIMATAFPDQADRWSRRLIETVESMRPDWQAIALAELRRDPDFDAVRRQPEVERLLQETGFGELCLGVWQGHVDRRGRLIAGTPAEHARLAEECIAQGLLPTAIETADDYITSVWNRQIDVDREDRRLVRAAVLAVAAAWVGEAYLLESMLSGRFGPAGRDRASAAVAAAQADPQVLMGILRHSTSSDARYAALCGLADYPPERLAADDRKYLQARLPELAVDADAGVAAAAAHLIRLGLAESPRLRGRSPAMTTAPDGTLMVRIQPPERVWIGSYNFESERQKTDIGAYVSGTAAYEIAQTETTVAQFAEFLEDDRVRAKLGLSGFSASKRFTTSDDCPRSSATWFEALMYCQWLSEAAGIPKSQSCFPGIWDADAQSYQVPDDVMTRTGYRLPTDFEWEYAADTGSAMTWPFGWTPALINRYAWTAENSGGVVHPVAGKLPNRFGLFDTLGNVGEWTLNPPSAPLRPSDGTDLVWDGFSTGVYKDSHLAPVRGGSFLSPATSARSSERSQFSRTGRDIKIGFRVARTVAE